MKPVVSIRQCASYEPEKIQMALFEAVRTSGGIESVVSPGDRVLLKINLLNTATPEKAVTTHPEITRAAIRLVKQAGGQPLVGDAPGMDIPGQGKKALRNSGTIAVCEAEDVPAVVFTDQGYSPVSAQDNVKLKNMHISRELLEADVVIGLSKAKSHMLAYYSGAIKNFFGAVPAADRKYAHAHADVESFSQCLVDIFRLCRPDFGIMDAVVGMEGRGPSDGQPRNLGLVLASKDLVALDSVTSEVMDYQRLDIPHIRQAADRGLGENKLYKIEIDGPPTEKVKQHFVPPPTAKIPMPGFLNRLVMKLWKIEPKITADCVACGHCAGVCPVQAIDVRTDQAVIDYKKCIGCFCCHELCPSSAIKERTSLIVKLFRLVKGLKSGGSKHLKSEG